MMSQTKLEPRLTGGDASDATTSLVGGRSPTTSLVGGRSKDPDPPDSTFQEARDWSRKPFSEGEDILVHDQDDGLIYFGIVVEVDHDIGQCLVRWVYTCKIFIARIKGFLTSMMNVKL